MENDLEKVKKEAYEALLQEKNSWNGTPEDFLEFMMMMELMANPSGTSGHEVIDGKEYQLPTIDNLAAIYLKIMNVDLHPYKDFEDLKLNGRPSGNVAKKCLAVLHSMDQEEALAEATSTPGITPHPETMAKDIANDLWTQAFMAQLSQHVVFSDQQSKK